MSLANSLNKFRTDLSDATSRNLQHSRPSASTSVPTRTSTPNMNESNSKRTHDSALTTSTTTTTPGTSTPTPGHAGTELLTQVFNAVQYLKEKDTRPVSFDQLINYLSLPNDSQKNIPLIKRALLQHDRVSYTSKNSPANKTGKETFHYKPLHPVTSVNELKNYLATLNTASGIPVKELKDGWPDCVPAINALEKEGHCLVLRNKSDSSPRTIYPDNPAYHITNPTTGLPQKADADFVDVWAKTKLPATEGEMRAELERAGLTPTSQVKDVGGSGAGTGRKGDKRRAVRRGGKTTNSHMLGILKDYSRR